MWMIQKIGVDSDGEIDRVQWQSANTTMNSWIGQPAIVPIIDVVDAVLVNRVGSVVAVAGGGTVQGPYVRTFAHPSGIEGIEADPANGEQRTLWDLPRLRQGQMEPD